MKLSTVFFSSTAFLFSMASSSIVLAAEKVQNVETETRTPTSITRTSSCSGSGSCSTSTSVSSTELNSTSSAKKRTFGTRFTENNTLNLNTKWSSWFNDGNENNSWTTRTRFTEKTNSNFSNQWNSWSNSNTNNKTEESNTSTPKTTKTFTETKTPTSITRTSSCKGSGSCSTSTSVSTTELTSATNKSQTQDKASTAYNAADCSAFADANSKLNGWMLTEYDFFGDYTQSELTPATSSECTGKQYYQVSGSGYDGNKVTFRSHRVEGAHKSQPALFTFWLRAADAYSYQSVDFECTLSKRNAKKLGKKLRTYPKQGVELKADQITKVTLDGSCDRASVFSSVYGDFQIINVEASY
ncbi:hypothetical protein [Zooshikella harenae]|uniref:Uncharacterized protein n=1 Tax=Zooshikella harenae TaxID=2827238 RepID=A0ABS5Z6E5_9GAMM|nr:hypothetical protein [Zooshikella harenae]MBU2709625.1 hypothetical protein [Zooshikella harenae]